MMMMLACDVACYIDESQLAPIGRERAAFKIGPKQLARSISSELPRNDHLSRSKQATTSDRKRPQGKRRKKKRRSRKQEDEE